MSRNRDRLDLQKHTLNLYAGDWDELRALFPGTDTSYLIRELVHACVANTKATATSDPQNINVEVKI